MKQINHHIQRKLDEGCNHPNDLILKRNAWPLLLFLVSCNVLTVLGYRFQSELWQAVLYCLYGICFFGAILMFRGEKQPKFLTYLWVPFHVWMIVYFLQYPLFGCMFYFLYPLLREKHIHWVWRFLANMSYVLALLVLGLFVVFRSSVNITLQETIHSPSNQRVIEMYRHDTGATGLDISVVLVDRHRIVERRRKLTKKELQLESVIEWLSEEVIQVEQIKIVLPKR